MSALTRRLFLRNTAAAGAVAATVAVPAVVDATEHQVTPLDHWAAFIASLGDRVPEGARIQIFGNATVARCEIMVTQIEQVHPSVTMPVERCVGAYRLLPEGWVSEGWACA